MNFNIISEAFIIDKNMVGVFTADASDHINNILKEKYNTNASKINKTMIGDNADDVFFITSTQVPEKKEVHF